MHLRERRAALAAVLLACASHGRIEAQDHRSHMAEADTAETAQAMAMQPHMFTVQLGSGWRLLGMAQVIPSLTTGFGSDANENVTQTELYATQPAVMFNVESRRSTVVLRTTLNFEGITQPDGELTFGGWGEGFIDRRHPHTFMHEAMLSVNIRDVEGGALSLSAGRGFAPYGTDDPMARPVVK